MVRSHAVYYGFGLLVLAQNVYAYVHVGALDLVVQRLSYVVEEARSLGKRNVEAKLACHKPGKVGNFSGVRQNVLSVAGPVVKSS